MLTGRPGGYARRARRGAFHPDPHAVGSRQHTSLPDPLPSRYGYPITQDIVAYTGHSCGYPITQDIVASRVGVCAGGVCARYVTGHAPSLPRTCD
jgi:hypothetical protein